MLESDETIDAILRIVNGETALAAAKLAESQIPGCAGMHIYFAGVDRHIRLNAFSATDPQIAHRLADEFGTPHNNPLLADLPRLSPGRLSEIGRFTDAASFLDSEVFHEIFVPAHVDRISMMYMPHSHGTVVLGIGQEKGAAQYDRERIERTGRLIARAFEIAASSAAPSSRAFLIDTLGVPAALSPKRVEEISFGALTSAGPMRPVRPTSSKMQNEFRAALVYAASGRRRALVLPGDSRPCRVALSPGPTQIASSFVWVELSPLHPPEWSVASLAAYYGLTPREASVALALLNGRDAAAISAEFGLSARSVRTYLSSIFQKTGATGQVSLIRQLNGSAS